MAFDTAAAKATFFDRAAVADKLSPAVRRALSKFGAYVRTRSRSSIRKRKKVSPAGSPPSSHVGTLKKLIFFGYDEGAKSVVIGPVVGGSASGAPRVLEYGGTGKVKNKKGDRVAQFAPRPYMRPALETELATVRERFKDLIR